MKIALCTICKNEEKFIDRWLGFAKQADVAILVDTGSTDHTQDKISANRPSNLISFSANIMPFRFDTARNIALSFVPVDVDWCVWLDLDEYLDDHWRNILEDSTLADKAIINVSYHPVSGTTIWREKIHCRSGIIWTYPVHETPLPYAENTEYGCLPNFHVYHSPDVEKVRDQYGPLSELAHNESGACFCMD